MATLNGSLDPRRNSLNAIRLALASSVIISHAWAIGGYGDEPALGGINLGTWALLGFFGISGYLITKSRMSKATPVAFYWNRFVRIVPGFLVSLIVVTFGFAPIAAAIAGVDYPVSGAIRFLLSQLFLSPPFLSQPGIGETLSGTPIPVYWNGPWWSLFWEGACYVLVGVVVSVFGRGLAPHVMVAVFGLSTVIAVMIDLGFAQIHPIIDRAVPLLPAFAAGSLIFFYGDKIKLNWQLLSFAVIALGGTVSTGTAASLAGLPLIMIIMMAGVRLPFHSMGRKYDLSYGLYVYGWPVQQALALLGAHQAWPVWWFVLASLGATAVFAFVSFVLVERPAVKLKTLVTRSKPRSGSSAVT